MRDILLIGVSSFATSYVAFSLYNSYRRPVVQKLMDCPYCNEQLVISYAGL